MVDAEETFDLGQEDRYLGMVEVGAEVGDEAPFESVEEHEHVSYGRGLVAAAVSQPLEITGASARVSQ